MATDYLNAAQWALHAVTQGWSARAGLDRYRAEGGHIADATWFRLTGEIQATLAQREGVYNEPVNLRPVASEIRTWEVRHGTGFIHQVEVLVRDRKTNQVISVPYSAQSRTLRSRISVLTEALSVYSDENAKKYDQQILGAIYTGTYQMIPSVG